MVDTLTPVLNRIGAPGNTWVLPEYKLLYVSVTKVACTSIRWMIADLAGEVRGDFYASLGANQSRLMTIHRPRQYWKRVPQLVEIGREARAEISRDNGWLIFAVVRDPWSRLFSAWQSKFLVRHAYYVRNYVDEPWFPRVPSCPEDVIEDFHRFVFEAPWETHPRLSRDVHFRPQVESVRPSGINYTKIYDLSAMPELIADIHAHLAGLGKDRELYLPRANETPLTMIAELLKDGVAEEIERRYASDFAAFGDRWRLDDVALANQIWTADAIKHAAFQTVANQRIGDLSQQAQRLRRALMEAEREIESLRASPPRRRRTLRHLAGGVKRRTVSAVSAVRRRAPQAGDLS